MSDLTTIVVPKNLEIPVLKLLNSIITILNEEPRCEVSVLGEDKGYILEIEEEDNN